jgi:predicted Zn-dependent peptidase
MITSARNYVMGQFPPRLETAAQLAGQFALLEFYGLGVSYIDDYGNDLGAATTDTIAAVIDEVYPSADNLVFVILGDAALIRDQLEQFGPVTELPISAPRFHP